MRKRLANQEGFTLVEIIAVLILLGILAAVAVPKYIDLTTDAEVKAVQAFVAELNGRENMAWAQVKLTDAGWVAASDAAIETVVTTDLGTDFTLSGSGADYVVTFKSNPHGLARAASTTTSPGLWTID